MEQRIHLAEQPPAFCAACYQAKPQSPHVDFGAAYDGPTFARDDNEVVGANVITVDDLVICDECITLAAQIFNLGDVTELREQLEHAHAERERLSDRLAAQAEHITNLERAAQSRAGLATTMAGPAQPDEPQRRARGGTGGRRPKTKAAG